jgi:lipopolysaccharide export system permease protein
MLSRPPAPLLGRTRSLDWYVAKLFAVWIVIVLVALLALLQILDLIGESNRILAVPGSTEASLWRYVLLRLPILMSQFLAFAVLLAALVTFTTLAYTSEIVIMKSAGISPHRLLLPMAIVAGVCALVHFVANETVVVRAAEQLQAWQATDYGKNPEPESTDKEVWAEAGGTIIRAHRVSQSGTAATLEDIAVFTRASDGALSTVTFAKRGVLTPNGGLLEQVQDIDLATSNTELKPSRFWDPGVAPAQLFSIVVDPSHVSFQALRQALKLMQEHGQTVQPLITDLHHKITGPLASILMPFLAAIAAFGLVRRRTILLRAAVGLVLGFGYFVTDGVITTLGRSAAIPPQVAAWIAILIFSLLSQAMLFHMEE